MDELTRARRVERIADGLRMECWGLDGDGKVYQCSWYEGNKQVWGSFPKEEIRSVAVPETITDQSTDWRKVKW